MVNVKKYIAYHFVFTAFLAGILLSRCNNKTTDEYFYCINYCAHAGGSGFCAKKGERPMDASLASHPARG